MRDGKTVLSPVRAVEEFCWRDTPWGDMTRIQNRTERWDAPEESVYPSLHTRRLSTCAAGFNCSPEKTDGILIALDAATPSHVFFAV